MIKAAGSLYTVLTNEDEIFDCKIKGNLRIKDLKSTNPVTVGDKVNYLPPDVYGPGVITEILPRKNYIIRRSTNLSKQYHIIAANIDQALLFVTITEPETNLDFINRYLVAAHSFRIPVVIVFNKIDLCIDSYYDKYLEFRRIYENIGYNCIAVSATNDFNFDEIKNLLKGKISVINGNSGVGKSTIIKKIDPTLNIKIGEISIYHKAGVHTTSYSQMYKIDKDSFIIDTPGIKGFGLIDFDKEELYHYFPEIFEIASKCKFYNCTHIHEPGCAVLDAVRQEKIAFSRYSSYFNLFHDENEKYRSR